MIQFRRKLSLLLLIICVLFSQRVIVYGQGVSIEFSSLSSGSIQITTQSWGNINPSSQPTPITTTTGASTTTYSSTTPMATNNSNVGISNLTTTSAYQKNNNSAGPSLYNPIDPTELTKELTRPVTFSPLSENESLLPNAESYIVTVCLAYNNVFVSGCSSTVTPEQASEKLSEILLNRYFNGTESRPFRVVMPSTMPTDQQTRLLNEIELKAGSIVAFRIFKADGTSINEYDKIAKEEAKTGVNWSHTSNDDKSIHDFYTKKVLTKISKIALQEKSPNSKSLKNN